MIVGFYAFPWEGYGKYNLGLYDTTSWFATEDLILNYLDFYMNKEFLPKDDSAVLGIVIT